jgi:hypothetical protein
MSVPQSIELFIEGHAFWPSYDLVSPHHVPPPPHQVVSLSHDAVFLQCRRSSLLTKEGGGGGWERSQIILQRESLVLYISINTLWPLQCTEFA